MNGGDPATACPAGAEVHVALFDQAANGYAYQLGPVPCTNGLVSYPRAENAAAPNARGFIAIPGGATYASVTGSFDVNGARYDLALTTSP